MLNSAEMNYAVVCTKDTVYLLWIENVRICSYKVHILSVILEQWGNTCPTVLPWVTILQEDMLNGKPRLRSHLALRAEVLGRCRQTVPHQGLN